MICDARAWNEVEEDDTVEILDTQLRQVYLSFNAFEHCNYSITELCSYPFYELYERPPPIQNRLVEATEQILQGAAHFTHLGDIETYAVRELRTEVPEMFQVQEKFMARLRCTLDRQNYILWVKKLQPAGPAEQPDNLRYLK